jgi:predicted transcriptional regulator
MLAALGLGPEDEDIYRRLVALGGTGLEELATDTGRTRDDLRTRLDHLARLGLVTSDAPAPVATVSTLFSAAPPEVALGAVLRQRRDDLRTAEFDLIALAEQYRAAADGRVAGGVIEVITDIEAVRHRYAQIHHSARHQVRATVVPRMSVVPHRTNSAADDTLRRGVASRVILHRDVFDEPGMFADTMESLAEGQQIRVAHDVPVKLVIGDDSVAMVPLPSHRNTAAASILVRPSGLLDALIAFFEAAWERAYPLPPEASGPDGATGGIDELDARILALVLAGLTDQAVAGQLRISRRTVQRRIHELMVKAGVDTRIQLGWRAARYGWA